MIDGARYIHTNLIARDWRALAAFYGSVFGCVDAPPERDFASREVEAGTGVPGAALRGMHMRLPGWGADGPAFAVESVADARAEVLANGGRAIGDIVTVTTSRGTVTWCYVTDPEGNIVELQTWR